MAFDSKPNLSNDKFEQFSGETLTLAGTTEVHGRFEVENGGIITSDSGYEISGTSVLRLGSGSTTSLQLGLNADTSTALNAIAIGNQAGQIVSTGITHNIGSISMGCKANCDNDIGTNSIGIGSTSKSYGASSIGIGNCAIALCAASIALGDEAKSYGTSNINIGCRSGFNSLGCAVSFGSIAMGQDSNCNNVIGSGSIAIGQLSKSIGSNSTAIGISTYALSNSSVAIGDEAKACGTANINIGCRSGFNSLGCAVGATSISMGHSSNCNNIIGTSSVALGTQSKSIGVSSVSIGVSSCATGASAIAIGATSNSLAGNTIAIGVSADSNNDFGIVIGNTAISNANCTVVIGTNACSEGSSGVAIGLNSRVLATSATAVGQQSHSYGSSSVSLGVIACAEGIAATALGAQSRAYGICSIAMGKYATTCNTSGIAIGAQAAQIVSTGITHGTGSVTMGCRANCDNIIGITSVAIGGASKSIGSNSIAIGQTAIAQNNDGIAIGCSAIVSGDTGIAIGKGTCSAAFSFAIGQFSKTNVSRSGAIGINASSEAQDAMTIGFVANSSCVRNTVADSFGVGWKDGAPDILLAETAQQYINGSGNLIIGSGATLSGTTAVAKLHLEGDLAIIETPSTGVSGDSVLVRDSSTGLIKQVAQSDINSTGGTGGISTANNGLTVIGDNIVLGGTLTGDTTIDSATFGLAIGYGAVATGDRSFAFGYCASATGYQAQAFGKLTRAQGSYSQASGYYTYSSGNSAHSEGFYNFANGAASHAEGRRNKACNAQSHAQGNCTIAGGANSHSGGLGFSGGKNIFACGGQSFNQSENTTSQVAGHGALADNSAILGGLNHNIESGNTGAAIIGGSTIKLTGTTYIDHTAVANLAIMTAPSAGVTGDSVLVRDSSTGIIKEIAQSSIAATGDGVVSGGTLGVEAILVLERTEGLGDVNIDLSSLSGETAVAGSNTEIQYNNSGSLGAFSGFTFNDSTKVLDIEGEIAISGTSTLRVGTGTNSLELGTSAVAIAASAVAIGSLSQANGTYAIALGNSARAEGTRTTSLGYKSACVTTGSTSSWIALGDRAGNGNLANKQMGACSIALGRKTESSANDTIAIGNCAIASANFSLAIGSQAACFISTGITHNIASISMGCRANFDNTIGASSIAIGTGAKSVGICSIGIGTIANAQGDRTIAMGYFAGCLTTGSTTSWIAIGDRAGLSSQMGSCAIALGRRNQASGTRAIAIGNCSEANALNSTALGMQATAQGTNSMAIGTNSEANSNESLALGFNAIVNGTRSAAIGFRTACSNTGTTANWIAFGEYAGTGSGIDKQMGGCSIAIGSRTESSATGSIALGNSSIASGLYGTALGMQASAVGNNSTAVGRLTQANGANSTALGFYSIAEGDCSVALGFSAACSTTGSTSWIAIGDRAGAGNPLDKQMGTGAVAIGRLTESSGGNSVSLGSCSCPIGAYALSVGFQTKSIGNNSVAVGRLTESNGFYSTALGFNSIAQGDRTIAIGYKSACVTTGSTSSWIAIGDRAGTGSAFDKEIGSCSIAIGNRTETSGLGSISIGNRVCTLGVYSLSIGVDACTTGSNSVGIGPTARVDGTGSIGIGLVATTTGSKSIAIGYRTKADDYSSVSIGRCACSGYNNSISIGSNAIASGTCAIAIGYSVSAYAIRSTILGGQNHIIESGNTGAAIVGSSSITLTGSSYIDHTAVDNLAIMSAPSAGGIDDVLTYDSLGRVTKVTQASISDDKIEKVTGATGNLAIFLADGNIEDSGVTIDSITGGSGFYFYLDRTATVNNTTTTDVVFLSGTSDILAVGTWSIDFNALGGNSGNNKSIIVGFYIDNVLQGVENSLQANASTNVVPFVITKDLSLTNAAHTFEVRFRQLGGGTAFLEYASARARLVS